MIALMTDEMGHQLAFSLRYPSHGVYIPLWDYNPHVYGGLTSGQMQAFDVSNCEQSIP